LPCVGLLISAPRYRAFRVCIAAGNVLADSQLQWFQFYSIAVHAECPLGTIVCVRFIVPNIYLHRFSMDRC
jgi:hypothetical protein